MEKSLKCMCFKMLESFYPHSLEASEARIEGLEVLSSQYFKAKVISSTNQLSHYVLPRLTMAMKEWQLSRLWGRYVKVNRTIPVTTRFDFCCGWKVCIQYYLSINTCYVKRDWKSCKPHKMEKNKLSIIQSRKHWLSSSPYIPKSLSKVLWIFAQNCALPSQQIIPSKTL